MAPVVTHFQIIWLGQNIRGGGVPTLSITDIWHNTSAHYAERYYARVFTSFFSSEIHKVQIKPKHFKMDKLFIFELNVLKSRDWYHGIQYKTLSLMTLNGAECCVFNVTQNVVLLSVLEKDRGF